LIFSKISTRTAYTQSVYQDPSKKSPYFLEESMTINPEHAGFLKVINLLRSRPTSRPGKSLI